MAKTVQVAVRLNAETAQLAERLAKLYPVEVSAAAVYRAAIERGLEALRAELEGPKPKARKRK